MAKFKDNKGNEWIVPVNSTTVKRVRDVLDIDLVDLNQTTINRLIEDTVLLVDVLWVLCERQAKSKKVSEEGFAERLVGDPIDAAVDALLEAIANFFPALRRSLLLKANEKVKTIRQKGADLAFAKIDDPNLEKQLLASMEAEMDATLKNMLAKLGSTPSSSATNSPGGSGSKRKKKH